MLYAIIHFDHPDPDGDKPNPWVVDYVIESKNYNVKKIKAVTDPLAELKEANPNIKYFVMEESRVL